MTNINPFLDTRPIPKVNVNVKVKVKTNSAKENADWNKAFGYIMKKPRTKLEFLTVSLIRKLPLDKITLESIKPYITETDYTYLKSIEDIFNTRLTNDIKSFIISILKVPIKALEKLAQVPD